ncbi:MAG: signal peptidase II [Bacteroidetes bacterium]|nr:signal peptidase II [Bacteroidota bacterium]
MRVLFVSFFIILIDQLSKLAVKGFSILFINFHHIGMFEGERIRILGDFFRITFIENPGMAFGLNPGISFKLWITIFSLLASSGIVFYLFIVKNERFTLRFSLALILGGAIGNLIDRIFYGVFYGYAPLFYGKVVDFLDVDFFHFALFGKTFDRWPIFNVADASVTIGVLILLIFHSRTQEKKQDKIIDENTPQISLESESNDTKNTN